MKDETQSNLIIGAVIAIMVFLLVLLFFGIFICDQPKAEQLEILIHEYPFWRVSTSGDSTFQTVQLRKCWEIFPNGQRELLGYKVAVDSSGIRIYEEKPEWFLRWAVNRALNLRNELVKQKGER